VLIAVLVAMFVLPQLWPSNEGEKVTYTDFVAMVNDGDVESATINNASGRISFETKNGDTFFTTGGGERALSEADEALLKSRGVVYDFKTPTSNWLLSWASLLLPIVLIIGFFVWMQRRAMGQAGNIMSVGRSRAKTYDADKPSTTFADIAGYEGVKQEITEVVDFLRMPERFREIGARVPKGMLLVGPPGTGKTLFARAVAGEAGVGFLSVTGSDFMEMFVGVGASRVRDLFQQARKMGRAIIFIDEIDSIGRKRGAGLGGGHDEREQTLNQMLAEMDGFETSEGIVILAATNRPDILDPALLRPGRFDRQIVVPLPEAEERHAILKVHSRDKRMGPDVDLMVMAKATPGMSGADLANLVNEAALFAVRRNSQQIERIDFENARDRVVMGARRESLVLSGEEKKATAYHEGGHAVLTAVLPHADPLHKVTILPRGMALGVTWSLPEERHTYSKEYFEDVICRAMGGRVAEKIVFGHLNSGAANDLEQATSIARRMVREWGMSERVGPMAWHSQQQVFLGEDLMNSGREYSDDTAKLMDEEISRILLQQEQRAHELLLKHRGGLDLVAGGAAREGDDRRLRGQPARPGGPRRQRPPPERERDHVAVTAGPRDTPFARVNVVSRERTASSGHSARVSRPSGRGSARGSCPARGLPRRPPRDPSR
jgi:cell division protease FtsH